MDRGRLSATESLGLQETEFRERKGEVTCAISSINTFSNHPLIILRDAKALMLSTAGMVEFLGVPRPTVVQLAYTVGFACLVGWALEGVSSGASCNFLNGLRLVVPGGAGGSKCAAQAGGGPRWPW